jgi:putative SOS response-associated peptidase YedK
MCNYYDRHRPASEFQRAFGFVDPIPNLEPRYVVRPTDTERVVAIGKDGARHFPAMRWGLVPPGSSDIKTGLTLFNARAETIRDKRIFAEPFAKGRRCLVPVDGFYEFTGPKGQKQPHLFRPRDGRVMAFAGLWESWRGPRDAPLEQPLLSYTFITTEPNAVAAPIHNRMPVVFADSRSWDAWLDPTAQPDELVKMLQPADNDLLEVFPVTRDVLKIKAPDASVLAAVSPIERVKSHRDG